MKYDVFISYARKDVAEVLAIKQAIEKKVKGIRIWFDINGIESGDEFEDKIIKAINNSSYILFALSPNSIKSQWTKDEVMYAKNTGKKVIPILLRGAKLEGWFLFKFDRIDCIDSTNHLQMDKLIKNLSNWCGLEEHPEAPKEKTKTEEPHTTPPTNSLGKYKRKNGLSNSRVDAISVGTSDSVKIVPFYTNNITNNEEKNYYCNDARAWGSGSAGAGDGRGIGNARELGEDAARRQQRVVFQSAEATEKRPQVDTDERDRDVEGTGMQTVGNKQEVQVEPHPLASGRGAEKGGDPRRYAQRRR